MYDVVSSRTLKDENLRLFKISNNFRLRLKFMNRGQFKTTQKTPVDQILTF